MVRETLPALAVLLVHQAFATTSATMPIVNSVKVVGFRTILMPLTTAAASARLVVVLHAVTAVGGKEARRASATRGVMTRVASSATSAASHTRSKHTSLAIALGTAPECSADAAVLLQVQVQAPRCQRVV